MLLTKLLQKDYTKNSDGYQLKLPLNLETIIPDNDSVRLLSQFVEAMDLTDLYSTYERINSQSSRQLKKYKFFLPAEIYLLAVFMRLASKFRVFPLVLKFRDSFVSVYCYSNLYNLRSFLREYFYQ